MKKLKVGIVGCGNISQIYFEAGRKFDILEIVGCADITKERAWHKAKEFGIQKACSVKELLVDPTIEVIVNLTIPSVHAEIARAALEAGKHVYGEKPLTISLEDGKGILNLAEKKGLRVGNAPDTFLGAGIQTCTQIIDDGIIGKPVAVTAFMMCHGHENWHPDPEFYYQEGGGPMFDMGPYYLSALVCMLGPIKRVTGSTRISFPERIITSQRKKGQKIVVKTPTHISGVIDFESGAIGSIITSFDVWDHQMPFIEIYGEEGTMRVPDPNSFGGPVLVKRFDEDDWSEVPLVNGFTGNDRGLGLAEMAVAIRKSQKHRADGNLAYHVLEVMQGIHMSSNEGKHYHLHSTAHRPKRLPVGINIANFNALLS
ncbi:Gfo/Idh/MocA family protein [Bacillus alkalicellulosilyticus]|uniref:Gfo/Idh/MocA family protein n=1 Tax=Alkalihalobacterium alkalicellulosilyticum TaxID=1912214 RepID=UPI000997C34B|nr:Gfo/Idh/MocA family oxidoreductase [Bacillus alkalicellulosilyticus]